MEKRINEIDEIIKKNADEYKEKLEKQQNKEAMMKKSSEQLRDRYFYTHRGTVALAGIQALIRTAEKMESLDEDEVCGIAEILLMIRESLEKALELEE